MAKFLGPDLRVALVATDAMTEEDLHARLGPATTWVSHLLQHAVASMLADPRIEALRQTARTAYAERRALLVAARRERGIEPAIAPDGMNVWIETDARADALAARGWRVWPARAFAVGDAARAVRVTTSAITLEQAAAFAADLAEAR